MEACIGANSSKQSSSRGTIFLFPRHIYRQEILLPGSGFRQVSTLSPDSQRLSFDIAHARFCASVNGGEMAKLFASDNMFLISAFAQSNIINAHKCTVTVKNPTCVNFRGGLSSQGIWCVVSRC